MPMQPDREIINSWIGLTLDAKRMGLIPDSPNEPLTLTRLLGMGAERVVYAVTGTISGKELVIKFPRNHLGFVLDLPPNAAFKLYSTIGIVERFEVLTMEEYEKEEKYALLLARRLRALRGSPSLAEIFALDLVWMRLANALMKAVNLSETETSQIPIGRPKHRFRKSTSTEPEYILEDTSPLVLLSKYSALLRCKFIRDILVEWSLIETANNEIEASIPFIKIIASYRPILVDSPSLLASKATKTLKELDTLLNQLTIAETAYKVENNPFLPYLAAIIGSYDLPEKAAADIAETLRDGGGKIYLQQLGQLIHVMGNDTDFLSKHTVLSEPPLPSAHKKMALTNLLTQVVEKIPTKELLDGMALFISELEGSRSEDELEPANGEATNPVSVPVDTLTRVGIYTRTSILTDRYNSHERALHDYCQARGWQNVTVYHDRVGSSIDEGKLEHMINDLFTGNIDPNAIGELLQMQGEDDAHRWDKRSKLLEDVRNGKLDKVLVHDFGRLANSKRGVFEVITQLLEAPIEFIIPSIGTITDQTPVPPTNDLDFD